MPARGAGTGAFFVVILMQSVQLRTRNYEILCIRKN